MRRRIAQEAARIMVEEGIADYLPAKQKAATRLGAATQRTLPRNEEIEEALSEYHRLYRATVQPRHIVRLRRLALEAMNFLAAFSPLLAGGVLDGTAGEFSPITLYLFPETPEDVIRKLMDGHIPFEEKSVVLTIAPNRSASYPALYFLVDGVRVELALLPAELRQQRTGRKDRNLPTGSREDVAALIDKAEAEIANS